MSESRTPGHRPARGGSRAPSDGIPGTGSGGIGTTLTHPARIRRHQVDSADAHATGRGITGHGAPAPALRRPTAGRAVRAPGGLVLPPRPPHHAEAGGSAGRIPAAYGTAYATPPPLPRGRTRTAAFPGRPGPLAPGPLPRPARRPRSDAAPAVPRSRAVAATH
ncbi:hypothetical protein [Streptomyces sp. TP-A0875]|uniref:hypothetical protein n=1 Tax=Streptomyces sp. TP-A0875 TaxID=552354 RepID=UPI0006B59548|nr:hypothetical protein [Streptomyces sp. TP-A0875]